MHNMIIKDPKYIYWQEGDIWLGHLEEFPDYITQGETLEDLQENLKDIYAELTSGRIQGVRRMAELNIA
jgi:predicted RNase H-like HicB family nuclease